MNKIWGSFNFRLPRILNALCFAQSSGLPCRKVQCSAVKVWGFLGLFFAVLFFLLVGASFAIAQSSEDVVARRATLEKELAQIETEIEKQRGILESKRKESVSLERDIAILNAKIRETRLAIRGTTLSIEKYSREIGGKEETIGVLSERLSKEKDSLAELMRKTDELDSYSLTEIVLGGKNLSEFFSEFESLNSVKLALQVSLREVGKTRDETEEEKLSLEEKKDDLVSLRALQELEKRRVEEDENKKAAILKISKGVESVYQKIIKSEEMNAAKIRAELFTLSGSVAIPFEKALEYAMVASKKTGVRPALILGLIAEESNLGGNVGTGTWRVDMKSPRDTEPFIEITNRLGLDPDKMPVSKKAWYGFGGAMGPAQFIPSTWVLYEKRIADATDHNPPNPWDPGDAFMAAAILLKDNGATKGTASAERLAALRYLAGWKNAEKKAYAFYGNDVMDLATKYERQIVILRGS